MDYLGGMPARPPQSNGNGAPGMQQGRIPGVVPMASPDGNAFHPFTPQQQQQPQSMLQLSAPAGIRRPPPHATMTPGVRVLNVQRFPGGPVNQRRILVPVTQQTPQQQPGQQQLQHMQQQRQLQMQQPREGETPPPPAASPPLIKPQLMQPVHLQLPPTPAAGMVRRPMPIAGTPQGRQIQAGLTPQQLQRQQHLLQQQRQSQQQQQQTPRGPAAASAGRPQQQSAAGTSQPRSAAAARTHGGATSAARAAGQSQQQPRYNRQQMQLIMRTTAGALEKLRQLRSTVQSSFVGETTPASASDASPCRLVDAAATPQLSEEEQTKRVEKMQAARGMLESLYKALGSLPNSTMPMYGGREKEMACILVNEEMREKKGGATVGEEIERTLMGEDLRMAFFASALESMGKLPMAKHLQAVGHKEGLQAHSSFLICLAKMQSNKKLQQHRNLRIRLLNTGPRDTRFEMCISTPAHIYPPTTVMRVVMTVCDGCLARATFLGPNELVDSSTEERSSHLVYRQMSTHATEALLRSAKGRQMSLMSSINSIFTFLQNYPQCLQMPCSECGKSLRHFMPPTRFVTLTPTAKYAHPDCYQP